MKTYFEKYKSGGMRFYHDDRVLAMAIDKAMYGFCAPNPFWDASIFVRCINRRFYICKNWNGATAPRTRWFGYQPKSQTYPTPGRAFFHLTVYYAGMYRHHYHFRVGSWGFGVSVGR